MNNKKKFIIKIIYIKYIYLINKRDLSDNNLSGFLPETIGQLTQLKEL